MCDGSCLCSYVDVNEGLPAIQVGDIPTKAKCSVITDLGLKRECYFHLEAGVWDEEDVYGKVLKWKYWRPGC